MRYVNLGNTDVKVSQLCMGTGSFGGRVSDDVAFHQLNRFLEVGGNFVDSARVYGLGASEEVLGRWFSQYGTRHQTILCTKGGHPELGNWNHRRCNPENLSYDLDLSLKALKTDYIDLFLPHRDDPSVPVADLVEWMEEQKCKGKILHYGCSNWTLSRIREAQTYAASRGYEGFCASEQMYSLADVNAEKMVESDMHVLDARDRAFHRESGMSMIAYMSISNGYLMKKFRDQPVWPFISEKYDNPGSNAILKWLKNNIRDDPKEYTVEDICLHYLYSRDFHVIALASFRTNDQMEAVFAGLDKNIPISMMEELAALKRN